MKSKIESIIFIEYIRNMIGENITTFQKELERELENISSFVYTGMRTSRDFNRMADLHVIHPYKEFYSRMFNDLCRKISGYMDVNTDMFELSDNDLYDYIVNSELIHEYDRTLRISKGVEKIIKKTVEVTIPDSVISPVAGKFIRKLSVGNLLMASMNLDSGANKALKKLELARILKGIGKNIGNRMKNSLVAYFTEQMYGIIENKETELAYMAVI